MSYRETDFFLNKNPRPFLIRPLSIKKITCVIKVVYFWNVTPKPLWSRTVRQQTVEKDYTLNRTVFMFEECHCQQCDSMDRLFRMNVIWCPVESRENKNTDMILFCYWFLYTCLVIIQFFFMVKYCYSLFYVISFFCIIKPFLFSWNFLLNLFIWVLSFCGNFILKTRYFTRLLRHITRTSNFSSVPPFQKNFKTPLQTLARPIWVIS